MSKLDINSNSVLALMAPTASGKTALAYELYDTGKYELVSVDSALIYRDMNIGTAKPTEQELMDYPHHLVNIISPTESYNVASFVSDVNKLIDEIHERGRIPLLVGGTMMYYMALFDGLSSVPNTEDKIRQEVEQWRQEQGITDLHAYLAEHDPVIADRLNTGDTQRITRAVEVLKQTGKPMSYWQNQPKQALAKDDNRDWIGFAVMPDRAWLHARIDLRLQMMWADGFINEVLSLIDQYPLTSTMPSMRCVGYRQVIDFLLEQGFVNRADPSLSSPTLRVTHQGNRFNTNLQDNSHDLVCEMACQDMQNKALYATRQLAKRQYTWLRKIDKLDTQSKYYQIVTMDNIEKIRQLV